MRVKTIAAIVHASRSITYYFIFDLESKIMTTCSLTEGSTHREVTETLTEKTLAEHKSRSRVRKEIESIQEAESLEAKVGEIEARIL